MIFFIDCGVLAHLQNVYCCV